MLMLMLRLMPVDDFADRDTDAEADIDVTDVTPTTTMVIMMCINDEPSEQCDNER